MRLAPRANSIGTTTLLLLQSTDSAQLREATATDREMVVTANPLATRAGEEVLAAGGTAVDAMIAIQTVLGLVEPQSSGIGGGAFVVYYDATSEGSSGGITTTFDARETAPALATEGRFLDRAANGTSLGFVDAWQSGLSIGVPGVPRMMESLHTKYGNLDWSSLFEPAKTLATNGFALTERTSGMVKLLLELNGRSGAGCGEGDRIFFRDPAAYSYFAEPGSCVAKPAGTVVSNPQYAATMDLLATDGADAFYTGPLAEEIVAKVAADRNPTGDATIGFDDLAGYEMIERAPVCKVYRDSWDICGMGPPSSGALAVGQMLGVLQNFDLGSLSPHDVDTVHLFAQAGRLAFADRDLYAADADFVDVPVEGMLNPSYLAERSALINVTMDMGPAPPGNPPGSLQPVARQRRDFEAGTSQVSIIDQYGNALSMTTTIDAPFGSGLMVRGFLLNNQLTDFSFDPTDAGGTPIANRVQPGKRPRSSMSPTIVLDGGAVAYVSGSAGGSRIIGFTAQSLLSMLDFGLDPQEAANLPHYQNRNGDTEIEPTRPGLTLEYDSVNLIAALEARGHVVVESGSKDSGLSIIQVTRNGFLGGADPRRDGTVGGRLQVGTGTMVPRLIPAYGTSAATTRGFAQVIMSGMQVVVVISCFVLVVGFFA